MTIPKNYISFSGKDNMVSSFNHWLMDTIQGGYSGQPPKTFDYEFYWAFDYPIMPQQYPAITTAEIGLFDLGSAALEDLMGHDEDGEPIFGVKNQTLIEISCVDKDNDSYTKATQTVRNLRDRIVEALRTERIPLKNFYDSNPVQIGTIELDRASNSINEKYLVDPIDQNVKKIVLIVRVFWYELFRREKAKTINANATIE